MAYASQIRSYLRGNDELRKDEYRGDHPLSGHCYVASEAFFHLNGGYDEFEVLRVTVSETTHWFLRRKDTGEIVDLTSEQFADDVPYSEATKTGFLTSEPSKRAQKVIEVVQ